MEIYLIIAFVIGVALTFIPGISKIVKHYDTIIHEVGHGVATLPFGAGFPQIETRLSGSGETMSEIGRIHQTLPKFLAWITTRVARFFSLMSGYSAPVVISVFLIALSISRVNNQQFFINEWATATLVLILLATLCWTLTDSLNTLVVSLIVLGFMLFLGMTTEVLIGAAVTLVLMFLGARIASILALLFTTGGLVTAALFILGLGWNFNQTQNTFFDTIFTPRGIDPSLIALVVFLGIGIFAFISARSFYTLLVSILATAIPSIIVIAGMLMDASFENTNVTFHNAPLTITPILITMIAGIIFSGGIKSFFTLFRIMITKYGSTKVDTDLTFAAQELGGSERMWFIILSLFTIIASIGVIVYPFFAHW